MTTNNVASSTQAPQIDVVIMVSNMQRLQYLIKPVLKTYQLLLKLQRWDSKNLSGSILLFWNLATAFLTIEMSLFLFLLLVLLLAILGYLYTKSGVPANWSWQEILTKPGEKIDNVIIRRQFYALLVQVNQMLADILSILYKIHQALSWGDFLLAIQCYSTLVVLIIMFHVLPLRWCILLLGDVFLAQKFVAVAIRRLYYHLTLTDKRVLKKAASMDNCTELKDRTNTLPTSNKKEVLSRSLQDLRNVTGGPTSDQFVDKYSAKHESSSAKSSPVKEHYGIRKSFQSHSHDSLLVDTVDSATVAAKDPHSTAAASANDSASTDALNADIANANDSNFEDSNVSGVSSNMFGRWKEFRRRMLEPQKVVVVKELADKDKCLACEEKFTSILKRKRICSNCGNHFCNNCCSKRLPKSFFGATSPTAQTDTVLVCNFCHLYLTQNKKSS